MTAQPVDSSVGFDSVWVGSNLVLSGCLAVLCSAVQVFSSGSLLWALG